ncbi:hypothetical protein [Rubinisphaera margarita]|uniref:hypothetical protein n=1 Tax=Rubinisphaera margarita TaxID=2909586 RepID=UPI001EE7A7C9|nr:hypothetical protein [Rubinisphaera margarita]MCG6154167.1 hypothetical protein [Rubinisphaera margarita]
MTEWYEIWADCGLSPPYLLLVHADVGAYNVIDPQEGGKVVFSAGEYESVKLWLLEDEYERMSERVGED